MPGIRDSFQSIIFAQEDENVLVLRRVIRRWIDEQGASSFDCDYIYAVFFAEIQFFEIFSDPAFQHAYVCHGIIGGQLRGVKEIIESQIICKWTPISFSG